MRVDPSRPDSRGLEDRGPPPPPEAPAAGEPGALAPDPSPGRERDRPGWSLPLRVGPTGRLGAGGPRRLGETARLVLAIVPGERLLEPEFGCRVHELPSLDRPEERQLAGALAEQALERWAPWLGVQRVDLLSVEGGELRFRLRAADRTREARVRWRRERAGEPGPAEEAREENR